MIPHDVLFEVSNVCKRFLQGSGREVRALDDISLHIPRGSFTTLVGPSGSGKTTLLAILGALERPSAGAVMFQGQDLARFSDVALARARRRMGFVFQDFSLIPGLPVWENITYPLIPRGVGSQSRRDRARNLLSRFGLEKRMWAKPGELSGGEQQRVALARALVGDPEVILADEPTSNLDPDAGRLVFSLLKELHAQGRTIILASHEPQARELATHILQMKAGTLSAPVIKSP